MSKSVASNIAFVVALATIAGLSGPARAAPCAAKTQASGPSTSAVDPASDLSKSPGAKAESPGTVGAMNSAGGGSFTADGKPTQPSGPAAGPDNGC